MRLTVVVLVVAMTMLNATGVAGERPTPPAGVCYGDATSGTPAAAPTPMAEVVRVLALLPEPKIAYADLGCGDGRWLFAAAERWPGVRIIGVELDPVTAEATREQVRRAGLTHRITIKTGDATRVDVSADVATAYLYADVLEQLRPRLEKLRAFASYLHRPPGLPVVRNGDSWFYSQPTPQAVAVWNGRAFTSAVCSDANCVMCRSIRAQLAAPVATPEPAKAASGQWVRTKVCNGRACWFEDRWVPAP